MQNCAKSAQTLFFLVVGIVASFIANASVAANDGIPSHCGANEFEFLRAIIHHGEKDNEAAILSLCGDRKTEPLIRMAYRFGTVGKVEMELLASAQHKAGISEQSDKASHAGLISIVFYNGPYAYEVSEGMGMTDGVRLNVYRNKKQIAGYESYEFESQLIKLRFDRASSPIFQRVSPILPW